MQQEIKSVAQALLTMQRMSWEQGVAAQAFFECGDPATGMMMVREALQRVGQDGPFGTVNTKGLFGITNVLDDAVDCGANGLAAWYAYEYTKDAHYEKAVKDMADWFVFSAPRSPAGLLYHNTGRHRIMLDGIYHLVPVSIVGGRVAFAVEQIELFHKKFFDDETGLYRQIWNDDLGSFDRRALWGGGNGWMAGALALGCRLLPAKYEEKRKVLATLLENLVNAMLTYLRDDHKFHDVLDDSTTFVEVTTALMLCYAIYTGIAAKALPIDLRDIADKILSQASTHVDAEGFIINTCASPTFDYLGHSAEAQAFYMLCHAAKARLAL